MVRTQCKGAQGAPNEALVVAPDGGVSGAVVWLDDIHEGDPLPEAPAATQDESRCAFSPHVLAMPAAGTLKLTNGDPANHAARFEFSPDDPDNFMKTLPAGGFLGIPVKPDWAGRVAKVTCPIHLWMWGYVLFFEHPYFAVTDAGQARITNVPPGTYNLHVWHEGLGTTYASSLTLAAPVETRVQVTVGDAADVTRTFALDSDGAIRAVN
jgi:hypothetical protein